MANNNEINTVVINGVEYFPESKVKQLETLLEKSTKMVRFKVEQAADLYDEVCMLKEAIQRHKDMVSLIGPDCSCANEELWKVLDD